MPAIPLADFEVVHLNLPVNWRFYPKNTALLKMALTLKSGRMRKKYRPIKGVLIELTGVLLYASFLYANHQVSFAETCHVLHHSLIYVFIQSNM